MNRKIYPTEERFKVVDKIMMYGWINVLKKLLIMTECRPIDSKGQVEVGLFPVIDINSYSLSSFEKMIEYGHIEVLNTLLSANKIEFEISENLKEIPKAPFYDSYNCGPYNLIDIHYEILCDGYKEVFDKDCDIRVEEL
ncbi:hypothetical protein AYI70_g5067 [Smittium culicis]|uniref:Uncharacterized protein n=1 Tax=Smittium culicis TaxID=133412 RepID=A0A1R1XWD0_9FUNG|nr:hypothetical protein AYI70_g5067 [Smittium culicis]